MNEDHRARVAAFPDPGALTPQKIEAKAVEAGSAKAGMSPARAFVLAVMAGFFIGLGAMFMTLVKSDATLSPAASSLLGGLSFSLGLFLVLVAGAELFTGNALMVIGRMHGSYSWVALARSWLVVYAGNLVGALLLAALLVGAGFADMAGGAVGETMVAVAAGKAGLSWRVAFFRGVLCNVLVCLAVWMGFAGKTVVDKLAAALLPVTCFVACGFEHCVANMFFLPMGLVANALGYAAHGVDVSALTAAGALANISAVTLGNIVGGGMFVALGYWFVYGRGERVSSAGDETSLPV